MACRRSRTSNGVRQRQLPRADARTSSTQTPELMHTGSLVSGLIMFQVILLALMGSNNAAREIAGERLIFEKEKFAGLRPVGLRRVEGGLPRRARARAVGVDGGVREFHRAVPRQPRSRRCLLLILVNAALTAVCLAISSLMKTRGAGLARFDLSRRLPAPALRRGARAAQGAELDHASLHRVLLGLVRLHPDDARHALLRGRAERSRRPRSPPRGCASGCCVPRPARSARRLHGLQEFALGVMRHLESAARAFHSRCGAVAKSSAMPAIGRAHSARLSAAAAAGRRGRSVTCWSCSPIPSAPSLRDGLRCLRRYSTLWLTLGVVRICLRALPTRAARLFPQRAAARGTARSWSGRAKRGAIRSSGSPARRNRCGICRRIRCRQAAVESAAARARKRRRNFQSASSPPFRSPPSPRVLLLMNWDGHHAVLWRALRKRFGARGWAIYGGILVCALAAIGQAAALRCAAPLRHVAGAATALVPMGAGRRVAGVSVRISLRRLRADLPHPARLLLGARAHASRTSICSISPSAASASWCNGRWSSCC